MEYIDKSNKSMVLGLFIFTITSYLLYLSFSDNKQKILDKYSIEMTDLKIFIISVLLASIVTYIVLVLFKEYLKTVGEHTFLNEPFDTRKKS